MHQTGERGGRPPFLAVGEPSDSLVELMTCIVLARFIELCKSEAHPSSLDDLELSEEAPDQSDGDCYGDHVRSLCGARCVFCELDRMEAAGEEWVVVV